jgi:hypothetical protein
MLTVLYRRQGEIEGDSEKSGGFGDGGIFRMKIMGSIPLPSSVVDSANRHSRSESDVKLGHTRSASTVERDVKLKVRSMYFIECRGDVQYLHSSSNAKSVSVLPIARSLYLYLIGKPRECYTTRGALEFENEIHHE